MDWGKKRHFFSGNQEIKGSLLCLKTDCAYVGIFSATFIMGIMHIKKMLKHGTRVYKV